MAATFPSLPGTRVQFEAVINHRQIGSTVELWNTEESIPKIPRILRWQVHEEPKLFSEATADQILVRPRAGVPLRLVVEAVRGAGHAVSILDRALELGDWRMLRIDDRLRLFWAAFRSLREALAALARFEPHYLLRIPGFDESECSNSVDADELVWVGARKHWGPGIDNEDNRVAVIDTGVDLFHPTLVDRLARDPQDQLIATNVVDPGWDPEDEHQASHGTYCSALAAGAALGTFPGGILRRGEIVPVKAFDKNGITTDRQVAQAVKWVGSTPAKARVISGSFANIGDAPLLYDALKELDQKCLFVTAAGNYKVNLDDTPQSPASFDLANVLVVGGLTDHLEPPGGWGSGKNTVDLSAPGCTIRSARRLKLHNYDHFQRSSGTSAATAIVAAGAALVQGAARHYLGNFLSPAKLKEVLVQTVTPLDKSFCDHSSSCGYLNLNQAITMVKNMSPDEPA